MKLYHGTSGAHRASILRKGLRPRGERKLGQWQHSVPSNARSVYLTSAYPMHFAFNAEPPSTTFVIFEIETERLDTFFLLPDEDVLEQAGRKHDNIPGDMKERTLYYRDEIERWLGSDAWQRSLKAMGTCQYLGTIPVEAISRMVEIPRKLNKGLAFSFDASISLLNYAIVGDRYEWKTRHLFGDPLPDHLFDDPMWGAWIEFPHEGLMLSEFEDGRVVRKRKLPPCKGERHGRAFQEKLMARYQTKLAQEDT